MSEKSPEKLRQLILERADEGQLVLFTVDGLVAVDLKQFVEQSAESMLYDLNRDRATILTHLGEGPKRMNDFAVNMVIRHLKSRVDVLADNVRVKGKEMEFTPYELECLRQFISEHKADLIRFMKREHFEDFDADGLEHTVNEAYHQSLRELNEEARDD